MIALRRSEERGHDRHANQEVWCTFDSQAGSEGFGTLERFNEHRLLAGAEMLRHVSREAEIFTYVREGALASEDSNGLSGVIQSGEFQRRTGERGVHCTETNASRIESVHMFQFWLTSSANGSESGPEQKRFTTADRRDGLRLVASPDARRGSLRIGQDALIFSALLNSGQHVVHALGKGRNAWLHLVQGEATLGDLILTTGDGVGVTAERAVSLTAREKSEILLLDLGA